MQTKAPYWFPAKRYGWGWGLPTSWQGWLVIACYVALLALGFALFPPASQVAAFAAYVVALTALVIAICWLKGEPPRWRWGDE
ncbi:MAG TPA: hypothetical protein VE756_06695 [Burkholderiales bacterium]|nr:hypothetical protein [Burkholderiales bacterium]